jgi:Immunity protein Imm1
MMAPIPTFTIERWDETGSLVAEVRGDIGPTDPVLTALRASPHTTLTAEIQIEDDRRGKLLIASRDRWAVVGWVDPSDHLFQLAANGAQEEVEMYIGGQETHLGVHELVPLVDAELALREFLTSGRGSLGLVWVER